MLIELDDMNRYTKEHLYDFLEGHGKENFSDENHERLIRIGFLLNHIYEEEFFVVFEYGDNRIKIKNEDIYESRMVGAMGPEDLLFHLMTLEDFDVAYNIFRTKYNRDKKITDLLDED